jgi:serpin B10
MGMPDAFSVEKADFSGMVKPDGEIMLPHIDKVEHETVLEVSEKGATAAAATAFALKAGSLRVGEIKELTLDRPFFCVLVDEKTGAVLFGGAVYDPEELELEG